MAEYIEREKVYETLNTALNETDELKDLFSQDYIRGCRNTLRIVIDDMKKIPAADVRPERHGTWVDIGDGYVACSECGEEHGWENYRASYCDTCGAKMSWEDNDNG